jgi:hypothetical protein
VLDLDALGRMLRGCDVPAQAWAAWAEPPPAPAAPASARTPVGACRDQSFLRWRYEQHPRFRYRVLRDEFGIAAYRVETVRGTDLRVLRIVDFLGGQELAEELVAAARRERVVFADFACTSPRFGRPLEAAGFAREDALPAELPGRFQPLEFSDRPVVSCFWAAPRLGLDFGSDDFYVSRADSDLDRPN